MNNRDFGAFGENMAALYLENNGYRILCRNYRCRCGELDIIALKDDELRFTEVKTRSSFDFGRPCEAVDRNKQKHIKQAAYMYLRQISEMKCRPSVFKFDVLEITINHIENAF